MATYTKETALYDTGKIGSDISDAGETASKYITAVDQNGIKVHAENGTNVNYSLINGEGLEVFQGTSASDTKSVAKFGSTARVGGEDDASITITDGSIIGTGEGGKEFFNFSDSASTLIVLKNKFVWSGIKASTFPSTLEESLSVTLPDEPSSTQKTVSLNIVLRNSTSQFNKTIAFTAGTPATKSESFVFDKFSFTIGAMYDGAKDISRIYIRSGSAPDNYFLTGYVRYYSESLAPCYEIGSSVNASGAYAFAEGYNTYAKGDYSHSGGYGTHANDSYSHAEGYYTHAEGTASHAEGYITRAEGNYSHAEGYNTDAKGNYSHSGGYNTDANGDYAHAEGSFAQAIGKGSHAQNRYTVATEDWQTVIGCFNKATVTGDGTNANPYTYSDVGDYAFIVGNGTDNTTADRSNALTVDWQGNVKAAGEVAGVVHTYGAITGGVWSDKSIGTGTAWKEFANFTIPEDGVWLVSVWLQYASNATGHRTMSIADSTASSGVGIYTDRRQAANGVQTTLRVIALVNGNTKYYVNTYHGASSALTCQGRYSAIKLGNSVNKIGG